MNEHKMKNKSWTNRIIRCCKLNEISFWCNIILRFMAFTSINLCIFFILSICWINVLIKMIKWLLFVNKMNGNFNVSHLNGEKNENARRKQENENEKRKIFMKIWKTLAIMHIPSPSSSYWDILRCFLTE